MRLSIHITALVLGTSIAPGCGFIENLLERAEEMEEAQEQYDNLPDWDDVANRRDGFDGSVHIGGAGGGELPEGSEPTADEPSADSPSADSPTDGEATSEPAGASDSATSDAAATDPDSPNDRDYLVGPDGTPFHDDRPSQGPDAASEAGYQCPDGMRYATNGDDMAFCLFDEIELPEAELEVQCNDLSRGVLGFAFVEGPTTDAYECPPHAELVSDGSGLGQCIFDGLSLPPVPRVTGYCEWLHDGYLGFQWPLWAEPERLESPRDYQCPDGMMFGSFESGKRFCLAFGLALPESGAESVCEGIADGTLGFSFDASAEDDYACPEPWTLFGAGGARSYCILDGVSLPQAGSVEPWCDMLSDGIIGFAW